MKWEIENIIFKKFLKNKKVRNLFFKKRFKKNKTKWKSSLKETICTKKYMWEIVSWKDDFHKKKKFKQETISIA